MQTKVCPKCNQEKPLTGFHKHKNCKFGVYPVCKVCRNEDQKEYYQKNKDKRSKYYKEYQQNNRDKILERRKEYRQKNKDKIAEYRQKNKDKRAEYERSIYNTNPQFKISQLLRIRTRELVRKGKAKKFCGYNDYIGCTPQELVEHLESQFHECPSTGKAMTWDNHGEWHIDHIRPLASFDLTKEEEFLQAHHYTNLQPLWAEENLSKGAVWDEVGAD